jgi:hypothetical protein
MYGNSPKVGALKYMDRISSMSSRSPGSVESVKNINKTNLNTYGWGGENSHPQEAKTDPLGKNE